MCIYNILINCLKCNTTICCFPLCRLQIELQICFSSHFRWSLSLTLSIALLSLSYSTCHSHSLRATEFTLFELHFFTLQGIRHAHTRTQIHLHTSVCV